MVARTHQGGGNEEKWKGEKKSGGEGHRLLICLAVKICVLEFAM